MKEPELFVDVYGNKTWYVNGKFHRLDGPAIECANGTKQWWVDGKFHRLDGPASIRVDGTERWWINGKQYQTQQEHAIAAFLWMNKHERT
jgi:hypothetical protein